MAWLYFAIGVTGICGIVVVAYLAHKRQMQWKEECEKILAIYERMRENE